MSDTAMIGSLSAGPVITSGENGGVAPKVAADVLGMVIPSPDMTCGFGVVTDWTATGEPGTAPFNFAARASFGYQLFKEKNHRSSLNVGADADAGGEILNQQLGPLVRAAVDVSTIFLLDLDANGSFPLIVQLQGGRNFMERKSHSVFGSTSSNFVVLTVGALFYL